MNVAPESHVPGWESFHALTRADPSPDPVLLAVARTRALEQINFKGQRAQ